MSKISWSSEWEEIYSERNWGKYPEIELVRFISRIFTKNTNLSKIKVLDMGCGTGASTWYLAREGFNVFAIDGSESGVEKTRERLSRSGLEAEVCIGDFCNLPYKDNFFDCVIDITSIQHNTFEKIEIIIKKIHSMLKKDSYFFGIMACEDKDIEQGYGTVSFLSQDEIIILFKEFSQISIDYMSRTDNNQQYLDKRWVVVAKK